MSLVAALLLGGCGSDGGGGSSSISGVAIDGYIRNAKACVDRNYNKICDSNEPSATTQSRGVFSIPASATDSGNYPIVIEAGTDAFDEGRGAYFATPLKLTAPAGVTTITPITSLVQQKISEGKDRATAEAETTSLLGVSSGSLYGDYIASGDTTLTTKAYDTATKIQSSGGNFASVISELGGGSSASSSSSTSSSSSDSSTSSSSTSSSSSSSGSSSSGSSSTNNAPTANNFTYGTDINATARTFSWLTLSSATDTDGDALTATIKTQGSKGTSAISGNNITYTPSANQSGTDTIELTISDTHSADKNITVTVSNIDTTPPTVTGTYPVANATGVGAYTTVDINFSESMDSTTLTTANITLSSGKACQVVDYNTSDYRATCWVYTGVEANALAESMAYTVTVSTSVKDAVGHALASAYTLSFTTGSKNKLPRLRTGQTTSYATNDDAWYMTNGSLGYARSFTRDGVNGIVTDNATNLVWQDDAVSGMMNWATAGTTCDALTLGGQSDWRLPSISELSTTASKGIYSAVIFRGAGEFANTASDFYWSSATDVSNTAYAWLVNFDSGVDGTDDKTNSQYVRCVRGAQTETTQYVRDSSKQVVLDTSSGLMWQDNAVGMTKSWATAISNCETSTLGGYTDWRLPNYNELYQLIDRSRYSPAISPVFQNTASDANKYYWSSSTYATATSNAWVVLFGSGNGFWRAKTTWLDFRCVRGGTN